MGRLILFKKSKPLLRLAVFFALIFILPGSVSIFAGTIGDYQKGVRIARESVDELRKNLIIEETYDGEKNVEYERQLIALIRKNMPPTEKIEWDGAAIETSNRWLSNQIDNYEKEENQKKRREILTAVEERLAALQEKLAEPENAAVSNRSKDEDKRKLAEILRRDEYQKPEEKGESLVQKWVREVSEWLEKVFPRPNISSTSPNAFQSISVALQIGLYVIIAAIIIFLLYKFAPVFVQKYRVRQKPEKTDRVILGERIGFNESAADLFGEAERLARAGNLREAIRRGYIALLCDLSDKKIIGLAQHKTNRDYLRDVRRRDELHEKMRGLTESFERHCYGFEFADETDWNEFKQQYKLAVSEKV